MATMNVVVTYQHSADSAKFGRYNLSLSDTNGRSYTIPLKFCFEDLWKYAGDTSSVAFDFLILAFCIYNADRTVNRALFSDTGWKRNIHLQVPVINVAEMKRGLDSFKSAANFLTGDEWDFEFVQATPYIYSPQVARVVNLSVFEKVSLFSGGLDSLIGFIDGCSNLSNGKRILLISHIELGKEGKDQDRIMSKCVANNLFTEKYERAYISAGLKIQRGNTLATEATFRARSILFFAAGIYCANAIDPSMPLIIPENGTISLNIPLDRGRRSACSTRTTHPVFLKRLQNALSAIGIQNTLSNPYQLKSKRDMVEDCCSDSNKKSALKLLCKESCSCAKRSHKHYWTRRNVLHCGVCLPCIYRRVSLSGITGLNNEGVGLDVFTPSEIQMNRTNIKRNRDFRSLLFFLKNRCDRETIESELIANGITNQTEIECYADFVLHSYNQVKDWIRANGSSYIKRMAGL